MADYDTKKTAGIPCPSCGGTEVAKAGQSLSPETPTVTTFSISQPEPWPVGAYQVEIAINDRVVETRTFEVR